MHHAVLRTTWDLFIAMTTRGTPCVEVGSHRGILVGAFREDGSGKSFKLTINTGDGKYRHAYWKPAA